MYRLLHYFITVLAVLVLTGTSCTVVRKYPENRPFHFENNIKIEANLSRDEKADIKTRLLAQIDDSAQIRVASKIPWPSFPFFIPVSVMENPTIFSDAPLKQSVFNMKNLMSSMGFRRTEIRFDTTVIYKKKQQRTISNFTVVPGPRYTFDTVVYAFPDSTLQAIAVESAKTALLKKGSAFDYGAIDQEISRLTDIFQNQGYQKISKEDIIAEVDTNYTELLDATLDPFEYASRMAKASLKSKQPAVDLYLRLRAKRDSTHFIAYTIGELLVYPDQKAEDADSIKVNTNKDSNGITIHSLHNTFDNNFIRSNIFLQPGAIFKRDNYSKTLNNFNKLGAWQNINVSSETDEKKKVINYVLKLQPAKKQFFSIDLEGSSIINTSQLIQVGSGRVGLATNFTLRNRNIGKRAIQLENNLRTGIEFNNFKKILSGEVTLTNRLTFPWLVAPVGKKLKSYFQQARTIASADYSYIDRFQFFQLKTFNTFLGYEWKPNPYTSWQFRPINFENTLFKADSLFLESISNFPLLLYTYNNGLIIGMNAMFNKNLTPNNTKKINLLKIYGEESGLVSGALFYNQTKAGKPLSDLYRFFKMDVEYKHIVSHKNSSLHLRAYAGGGVALTTGSKKGEVTLPFFKSFIAGGPNSMRGWAIRKLGIGSNVFYDTVAAGTFSDKYADLQLEGNLEYRFNLFQFYGFWMRGAAFTDIGNIWFRNDLNNTLKNAGFRLDRLGKDIAVASGVGARIDFSYFLLRFDLGFPVKDPRYGPDNKGNANIERFYSKNSGGWFVNDVWNKPTFQFAIGYPF